GQSAKLPAGITNSAMLYNGVGRSAPLISGGLPMGVRRQIYLDESDDRLLEERSRSTGLSVSELIRRAIRECYGTRQRLTWDEFFAGGVQANSAAGESWVYDRLFDAEVDDLIQEQLKALGEERSPEGV